VRLETRKGARAGVTLTEVLVAMLILSLLSLICLAIFSQARSSSEGGAQRIAMRAVQRQAQRRLTLLLRSAIAPNEVDPALIEPELGQTADHIKFHAPADLLDPGVAFDPRTPSYPEFTLERDLSSQGLAVHRSDGTGPRQLIGRDFTTVEFQRPSKRAIAIGLTARTTIRGAAGSPKTVLESSRNLVQLPGIR
jgi:prepilin-type N-terminal cleavage/methylation domain-containing protein